MVGMDMKKVPSFLGRSHPLMVKRDDPPQIFVLRNVQNFRTFSKNELCCHLLLMARPHKDGSFLFLIWLSPLVPGAIGENSL